MPTRLQSPSSINTFKQCKRKYYYQYIKKLPTAPSIHLVRGNIAHSALEDFFDIELGKLEESEIQSHLRKTIQQLFIEKWKDANLELAALELTE